jgi:hypothetical protein
LKIVDWTAAGKSGGERARNFEWRRRLAEWRRRRRKKMSARQQQLSDQLETMMQFLNC